MTKARTIIDISLIYTSKSGAVIVGILILPWYQRLLGPEAFGVVAAVLSLQAFLLMMDFGTSTIISRDIAAAHDPSSDVLTWRAAEFLLHGIYGALLFLAVSTVVIMKLDTPTVKNVFWIIFFWALAINNTGQSALLARRKYALAGSIQAVGMLGRAFSSVAAMTLFSADLTTFFLVQTTTAVAQMSITSWLCRRTLDPSLRIIEFNKLIHAVKTLVVRGKPLVLFGLSGAAVLQLDKIIIPFFLSPAALSPYFLASALCLTPVSVLAGPITQFFQPRIINSICAGNVSAAQENLNKLTWAIVFAVAIPSGILWIGRHFIINLWLHQQPIAADVVRYLEILLPGIAIGALGFVPYTILIAHQDYSAQANLSAAMSVLTLMATAVSAAIGSIEGVCWVYASYHSVSALISWIRAVCLQPRPPDNYATRSAGHALTLLFGIIAAVVALNFLNYLYTH